MGSVIALLTEILGKCKQIYWKNIKLFIQRNVHEVSPYTNCIFSLDYSVFTKNSLLKTVYLIVLLGRNLAVSGLDSGKSCLQAEQRWKAVSRLNKAKAVTRLSSDETLFPDWTRWNAVSRTSNVIPLPVKWNMVIHCKTQQCMIKGYFKDEQWWHLVSMVKCVFKTKQKLYIRSCFTEYCKRPFLDWTIARCF